MKAEIGKMRPQVKECLRHRETSKEAWHSLPTCLQREPGPADAGPRLLASRQPENTCGGFQLPSLLDFATAVQ